MFHIEYWIKLVNKLDGIMLLYGLNRWSASFERQALALLEVWKDAE